MSHDADTATITIRLEGRPSSDGRVYVTSPDFLGFHFVHDADEDPIEAMAPTLLVFASRALDAQGAT